MKASWRLGGSGETRLLEVPSGLLESPLEPKFESDKTDQPDRRIPRIQPKQEPARRVPVIVDKPAPRRGGTLPPHLTAITANVDGAPAANGTLVTAWIDGEQVGYGVVAGGTAVIVISGAQSSNLGSKI